MNKNTLNGIKNMLVDSTSKFRIEKQRTKQELLSPQKNSLHDIHVAKKQFNNQDIKRPLNNNHSDLSFKGLSSILYKPLDKVYSKEDFLKFTQKYLGRMGEELLHDITNIQASRSSKLITVDGENIVISKKTIPHLAWDGILYPFKILPADILNGLVEFAGHIPGLKTWSAKTLEKPFFKNIRQRSKIDSKINSLVGLITYKDVKLAEYAKKLNKKTADLTKEELADFEKGFDSKVFQTSMKMFDLKSGNYDTKHERSLNRLVSGLPPAVFLATDAHNLSIMMDGDNKEAKKEAKTRFKQETARILSSGYLTLITMGAFQKFINSSKMGIVITTGVTVLLTEMFSRLLNGKHITRLTPEQAREENKRLHAPEANIKPTTNSQISSTGTPDKTKETPQKPLLSFDTLLKASGVVLATGYGIKGFKHLPKIKTSALNYFKNMSPEKLNKLGIDIDKLNLENAVKTFEDKVIYKPFTDFYKNLTSEKYLVKAEDFDNTIKTLRNIEVPVEKDGRIVMLKKYEQFADQYEKIGNSAKKYKLGDRILDNLDNLSDEEKKNAVQILDFGMKDKKIKPLVNFVIAPFKFMWNTITLPYWMIDEKLMNVFRKAKPKSATSDLSALAKSFDKIKTKSDAFSNGKMTQKDFIDFIDISLLKAFNADSLSSVSNAELSNLAKTAATAATIWFLMTDNYNMVMLKSNGNDKEGANTKFKERFVQEGSRLFYQTLLIDLFNSTFAKQYNASLLGMSWVTLADTTLGEILTRSSVGMPVKPHTRDELIAIEDAQDKSTGFKKKYYNFMQRLTGKRSIKTYNVKNEIKIPQVSESAETAAAKQIFFQNNGTLDKLIKG